MCALRMIKFLSGQNNVAYVDRAYIVEITYVYMTIVICVGPHNSRLCLFCCVQCSCVHMSTILLECLL